MTHVSRDSRPLGVAAMLLFAISIAGCGQGTPPAESAAETGAAALPAEMASAAVSEVERIADEYLEAMFERYPSMVTYLGLPDRRHDRLFDNSPEALSDWHAREDGWLAALEALERPTEIGSRDWVTFGILHEELAASKATRICRKPLWETSTTTAWYTGLPFVFDKQPLDSPELRAQALQRLAAVDQFVDTEIRNLRTGLDLGYSSPRVTVEQVPEQVRALKADNTPFLAMGERANDPAFKAEVQRIVAEELIPAVERFAVFIEDEYLPAARESLAISEHPDGAECYAALIRSFATISPSADEIHSLGLEQIAGIRAEMEVVLDEHYNGEPIESFVRRINTDPEFTFESEEAVLQYSVDALDAAKAAMPAVFGLLPKADVVIKPYPDFAASGIGSYQSPAEDGSRPGIFYIATRDPQNRTRATQQATLFHETYPGHHLQIAIALELGDRVHPLARYLGNSGFSEGWGLYVERLAQERGLYTGPLDLMGLYSDQGARAARLAIDTGLHTRGWTRQQAVDYMLNNTGWAELDIQNDINRYISWPGQATSYMLGMLEIRRLRDEAEARLGERFDIREFHDRVLENGGVTLPMLNETVMAWIEANET